MGFEFDAIIELYNYYVFWDMKVKIGGKIEKLKSDKLKSFWIWRVSFTLCLAKTREIEGKGNDGREQRGKGREWIKIFFSFVWFVR